MHEAFSDMPFRLKRDSDDSKSLAPEMPYRHQSFWQTRYDHEPGQDNLCVVAAVCSVQSFRASGPQTINGFYKREVVRRKGPWKTIEALKWKTLNWVHWFNQTRLLGPIGHIPPAEFDALYERRQQKCLKAP